MVFTAHDPGVASSSISTTRPPLERYWSAYAPALPHAADLKQIILAIDSHLLHLMLEMSPQGVMVVDFAAEATGGATSIIALRVPKVRRVVAGLTQGVTGNPLVGSLRSYTRDHERDVSTLELVPENQLPGEMVASAGVLIILDARLTPSASLNAILDRCLAQQPEALIVLLGIGKIGESEALRQIVSRNQAVWLLRELAEPLFSSDIAVITTSKSVPLVGVISGIATLYQSTVSYVDLLSDSNRQACLNSGVDILSLPEHRDSVSVMSEITELKRQIGQLVEERQFFGLGAFQTSMAYQVFRKSRKIVLKLRPAGSRRERLWFFWRRHGLISLFRRAFGRKPS